MSSPPTISQVISSNSSLAQSSGVIRPVAVLLGGTSGIAAGTAKALTQAFNGNVHLILSSRSSIGAENVANCLDYPVTSTDSHDHNGDGARTPMSKSSSSTSFDKGNPNRNRNTVTLDFIQSDATDVKNMKKLAEEIKGLGVEKVNYLVLSCGQLTLNGSERTEAGVERKLAMNFYSRWSLTYHLLPLLRNAASLNEPAKVMSILAPSRGGKIDTQDFGLYQESQRSGSSVLCRGRWLREAEKAGVTYNDFMTEWFSTMKGNEGLGFVHAFPGFVKTPMLKNFSLPIRILAFPLVSCGASETDSGQYMLSSLLSKESSSGFSFIGPKGEALSSEKNNAPASWEEAKIGSQERRGILERLWEHLREVGGLE